MTDGRYSGNMLLVDSCQTAENDALRQSLKIPAGVTGLVVTNPYRDDEDYPLKKWDVITHVGPHPIDNQGFVDIREGLRMRFQYYVSSLAQDGRVPLTILRDGEKKEISMPVLPRREFLVELLEDRYPEYFIYGPLVFTAASQEYVRSLGPNGMGALLMLESPLLTRMYDRPTFEGEQLVVIATRMFPHSIIKGYDNRPLGVIANLNGKQVKNLRCLAELLRDNDDEFVRFEMSDRSETLVFRRAELQNATEEILSDEGIRYQASDSVRDIFAGQE
jgi:hypothetical protein